MLAQGTLTKAKRIDLRARASRSELIRASAGHVGKEVLISYQEMAETLKNLELFCPDTACGDPVIAPEGSVIYRKRQMTFAGFQQKPSSNSRYASDFKAQYICPVCGRVRKFESSYPFENFKERS